MYCKICSRQTTQFYNGQRYCINHHPQAVCPNCGRHIGRFPRKGEWCKACQEKHIKTNQMALALDYTPVLTGEYLEETNAAND